jgi:hypothetical protein
LIRIGPSTVDKRGTYGHEQRHIDAVVRAVDDLIARLNGKDTSRAKVHEAVQEIITKDTQHELPRGAGSGREA